MQEEKYKGKFIVLEGIDGSGLSTQSQCLKTLLESEYGLQTVSAKEPSDGPFGSVIRQVLSDRLNGIDSRSLALLFAADRIDHGHNKLIPALRQGKYVVCDRYLWSSLAYQGRDIDFSWLETINKFACKPDLTIFIRVRPEVSLERITGSRLKTEIFEKLEILEEVYQNYIKIFKEWQNSGKKVVAIDGEQSKKKVTEEIKKVMADFLKRGQ